jgi:hypothetical protein
LNENNTGVYTFRFDARAPDEGAIAQPATAFAYVQTLDPANGFATTGRVEIDLSNLSSTEWQTFSVDFAITDTMAGQLLEFGFSNRTTNFGPTGIVIDNVGFNESAGGVSFSSDFESGNPNGDTIGDGWLSFGAVFNAEGGFVGQYGPFPSPNGTNGFTSFATGEQTAAQGSQYLNVFSDYNNGDHGNGLTIEALSFQERPLAAADAGAYSFTFDAKAPLEAGIAPPSTAFAFIRVIDPNNGFSTTVDVRLDMSNVSNTEWSTFTVEATLDASVAGQILQFGFSNSATAFNPTGIYYDNVNMSRAE